MMLAGLRHFGVNRQSGAVEEVWPEAPSDIGISNVYFELVPWEQITHCLDENGEIV